MAEITDVETPLEEQPVGFDEVVELVVPARNENLRLVRLAAIAVASTIEFGLESLEELRIAVDELAAIAFEEAAPGERVSLWYSGVQHTVTVTGRVRTLLRSEPDVHRVAKELLDMTADSYSVEVLNGVLEFHLVKHGNQTLYEE